MYCHLHATPIIFMSFCNKNSANISTCVCSCDVIFVCHVTRQNGTFMWKSFYCEPHRQSKRISFTSVLVYLCAKKRYFLDFCKCCVCVFFDTIYSILYITCCCCRRRRRRLPIAPQQTIENTVRLGSSNIESFRWKKNEKLANICVYPTNNDVTVGAVRGL